jgi:phosphoglucosamine mutase
MTNMAIEQALAARGVRLVRANVGDRYVLEALHRHHWLLGGEGSGHLIILDKQTTGDGIVSALQVLQACLRQQRTLADVLRGVERFPQVLRNVRLAPGADWRASAALQQAQREAEAALGANGRVLIRASGTEPVLRVMVEARRAEDAERWAARLAEAAVAGAPVSA